MGLQILTNRDGDTAVFFNSTSMWAFGPVAQGDDAEIQLIVFQEWLPLRPELYADNDLERQWGKFKAEYYDAFMEWMGDETFSLDWQSVKEAMAEYQRALEEAHEPYQFEEPENPYK